MKSNKLNFIYRAQLKEALVLLYPPKKLTQHTFSSFRRVIKENRSPGSPKPPGTLPPNHSHNKINQTFALGGTVLIALTFTGTTHMQGQLILVNIFSLGLFLLKNFLENVSQPALRRGNQSLRHHQTDTDL